MKLFEIDPEIDACLNIETGEFDEERYNALIAEREEKLEYLIQKYKNHLSDAEALKTQEKIFAERRKREEANAESLKSFISIYLNGEKFKTATVEVGFRKSKSVTYEDEGKFIEWCQKNDRDDLLSYKEPSVSKTAVKAAIEKGENVPASIVENLNIIIK